MSIIDFARCVFLLTDKAAVFLKNTQARQTATPSKSFDVALAIRLIEQKFLQVFPDVRTSNRTNYAGVLNDFALNNRSNLRCTVSDVDHQASVSSAGHEREWARVAEVQRVDVLSFE